MRRLVFFASVLLTLALAAEVETISLTGWHGTAYYDTWFAYALPDGYTDSGAVKLTGTSQFVLSPTYPQPIRKVVLSVYNSSLSPKRGICVSPLVKGVETGDPELERKLAVPEKTSGFFYTHFDWNASDGVTAFRVHLGSGDSGTWGVAEISVFYGERTEREDEVLGRLLNSLPPPGAPTIVDFTEDSLTAAAEPVAQAGSYRFALYRLDGQPRQEYREDFALAPACSAGWTLTSVNVGLSRGSTSYADAKVPSDKGALAIDKVLSTNGIASVEIFSPRVASPISACSFMCRIGTKGKSDRFAVYGRSDESTPWVAIATDISPTASGSNKYFDYAVDPAAEIRQVKFVFTAEGHSFTVAGLDSLCIVAGGNETRTLVGAEVEADGPTNRFANLAMGRYAFRVCALPKANEALRPSPWTEESESIDLAWANLEVSPPTDVTWQAAGEKLTISWTPVQGAAWYLLDVMPEEDPETPVVSGLKVVGCREIVTVPAVGRYVVRVTAVAPCKKSQAVSPEVVGVLPLEKMGAVTASALDAQTIMATWSDVPLAESYWTRLMRISGSAEKDVPDFSGLPDIWPEGWTHYSFDKEKYAGPAAKMKYDRSWIVTRSFERPVSEAVFKFRSRVTSADLSDEIAKTRLGVYGSASASGDADWGLLASYPVMTTMQTQTLSLKTSAGIRRLRFAVDYRGENPDYENAVNLEFLVLSITTGELLVTEERSLNTTMSAVTFGNLDSTARYRIVVAPQPASEEINEAASAVIDLSTEHFRKEGAVSLSRLAQGEYAEDFASLSNVTASVEARRVNLDYWQFYKGVDAVAKLLYQSDTNKVTTGGVYVCRDKDQAGDDLMLGLLSTGTAGASTGLAFRNDLDHAVSLEALSFDWVQRSVRGTAVTNRLEWMITEGATSLITSGEWHELVAARYISEKGDSAGVTLPLCHPVRLDENLPREIPVGGVLILRWRADKASSAPLTAIDSLTLHFPDAMSRGVRLILR